MQKLLRLETPYDTIDSYIIGNGRYQYIHQALEDGWRLIGPPRPKYHMHENCEMDYVWWFELEEG